MEQAGLILGIEISRLVTQGLWSDKHESQRFRKLAACSDRGIAAYSQ